MKVQKVSKARREETRCEGKAGSDTDRGRKRKERRQQEKDRIKETNKEQRKIK